MVKKKSKLNLLDMAGVALGQAVKKVIAERRMRGEPLIVWDWKAKKVVKIPAHKL